MDMAYSFLSEAEPTDNQLQTLMREVADDARMRRVKADRDLKQLIYKEINNAKEA
ncbi:hypothetical protein AGMMS4956_10370 [Bacteroidia bacterium]|nr:hypothetical protein AGMMS4956_10370 [Bacteroidia bacterium]